MNPFEIRLEILKMARDMLEADYYAQREKVANLWAVQSEIAKIHGTELPQHPGYPPYPTEEQIITKAQALNGFVSLIPQSTEQKTTSKKST
jgi:hypothetical protein